MSITRTAAVDVKLDEWLADERRLEIDKALVDTYCSELGYASDLTLSRVARRAAVRRAGGTAARRRRREAAMLTINEGIMEIDWGSRRFQAAVQTDEGPKTLEGNVVEQAVSPDIQSVSTTEPILPEWQRAITEVGDAIRRDCTRHRPDKALRLISEIWEHLDRVDELAAARTRILLGKLGKPKLAETPKWFKDQKPQLLEQDDGEFSSNPLAVSSVELLVQAVLAALGKPAGVVAELSVGPLGRVIADWIIPQERLQWMVEAIELPWPSVKVYQLAYRAGTEVSTPPKTRVLHNAFDVIDSFVELMSGD